MVDTAGNDDDDVFKLYHPIFHFACTLERLAHGAEEYARWTSVEWCSWVGLIMES